MLFKKIFPKLPTETTKNTISVLSIPLYMTYRGFSRFSGSSLAGL